MDRMFDFLKQEYAEQEGSDVVSVCAAIEAEMVELEDEELSSTFNPGRNIPILHYIKNENNLKYNI